jgi:hypothetical protein
MATVVHIGFHKTGTTTIQRQVFPRLDGCAVLRGGQSPEQQRFHRLIRQLATADDAEYSGDELRAMIEAARGDAEVLIVTHEDISGWPEGGRTSARLLDLVPDARILIAVREQRSALAGRYGQYVKKGGSMRFADYLGKLPHTWMRYDLVVEDYQARFGVDRVKVMAFEQLVRDQTAYLDELQVFVTGRDEPTQRFGELPRVNQTLAPPTRHVVRIANRWFVTSEENPRPPLGRVRLGARAVRKLMKLDPVVFPKMQRRLGRRDRELIDRTVRERCGEGNVRLAELSGLALGEYGYVLDSAGARAAV